MSNMESGFKGGNMSEVAREGEFVCRDMKPQSKTIHRLLLHLEEKGIRFVPRFISLRDENKERLSFVEGETIEDYPAVSDIQIRSKTVQLAAKMLKDYHDATLDFKRHPDDIWFLNYEGELEKEVICHNDFAPYNITFRDNKPIGMIDFDTACPAPRIWDVAYAVYRFVPLGMEFYDADRKKYRIYDKAVDCYDRRLLLKAFLDAYGNMDISEVLYNVIMRLQALVGLFDEECRKENLAFTKMKEEGHQQLYINEIEFVKENMQDWK